MSISTEMGIFVPEREALPAYIKRTENGLCILNLAEGKEGPYDAIYDFGWSREELRGEVPAAERISANTDSLKFVGLEKSDSDIDSLMRGITRTNEELDPANEQARFLYQSQLYEVYQLMKDYLTEHLGGERVVFFPPKNGGDLIRSFFQQMGVIKNPEDVVNFELKRILLEDGRLMVGVIDNYYPEGAYNTAVIIDDCLASDVSVVTTMDISKRYPSVEQTIVVVSAASQRGVEALLEEKNLTLLIAAVPVFAMSDNYYLLRTPEEGYPQETYFVGDMGKWAKSLPADLNELATWNRFR